MKLLIIGADGMDSRFVKRWINELPTMKRFMDEGALSCVRSTEPAVTSPAWTSIYTGLQSRTHGITGLLKQPGIPFTLADTEAITFWEILARAGIKVGLHRMPFTYPTRPGPEFWISFRPSWKRDQERAVRPMALMELLDRYKLYGSFDTGASTRKARGEGWAEVMVNNVQAAGELLWKYPDLDVFGVGFDALDIIAHKVVPREQPVSAWERELLVWYKLMDARIAELIDLLPAENVIVVSDHGTQYEFIPGLNGHSKWAIFAGLGADFAGGWIDIDRTVCRVAPTIMYLLGIEKDKWEHMEGGIAREMLRENQDMMHRLRGLGYI